METLQNLLTIAVEVVAIAGFGGITLHAIWSSHLQWMAEYCPPIAEAVVAEAVVAEAVVAEAVVAEAVVAEAVVAEAVVAEPVATEPVVVEPVVVEPVVVEPVVVEPAVTELPKPTFEEIDNTYKAPILRQLCEQYGITWKDIRGKGRHMLKGHMIQSLMSEEAF